MGWGSFSPGIANQSAGGKKTGSGVAPGGDEVDSSGGVVVGPEESIDPFIWNLEDELAWSLKTW